MSNKLKKRSTPQKKAIEEVFNTISRPLNLEEVLAEGRKFVPSLNQATVYRNLNNLVKNGWLNKIHMSPAGTLFEKSDKGHHHHFHCRVCQKSFEILQCALDYEKQLAPDGFVVESHELFFYGVCADCA